MKAVRCKRGHYVPFFLERRGPDRIDPFSGATVSPPEAARASAAPSNAVPDCPTLPQSRIRCCPLVGAFTMNYEVVEIILRLGAAAAAGVIIGINRDLTNKPIGMRTLGLVSLGAAVVSLATKLYRCGCYSTRCPSPNRRRTNDSGDGMGHCRTRHHLRPRRLDDRWRDIGYRPHTTRGPWLDGRRVLQGAKAIVYRATEIAPQRMPLGSSRAIR